MARPARLVLWGAILSPLRHRRRVHCTAALKALAPDGVDHIVEVALAANVDANGEALALGGSIAAYATNNERPTIPFWPMVFKNIQLYFLGSDDFPIAAKQIAAQDLNAALAAGWSGFTIAERLELNGIVRAHELSGHPTHPGRIVVLI